MLSLVGDWVAKIARGDDGQGGILKPSPTEAGLGFESAAAATATIFSSL